MNDFTILELRKRLGLTHGYVEKLGHYVQVKRSDVTIDIAKDFSKNPYSRTTGNESAKHFKEKLLKPFINLGAKTIIIVLDGANGYGSSWLHEAFGNLLKEYPQDKRQSIINSLIFISKDDPSLIEEINEYMKESLS